MKKFKKALVLFLCAVLLVAGSVMGTLAYLKSQSATATNTFTVGTLSITLDEAKTDVYGTKLEESRVTANTYKLVPGHTYTKDPVVHVAVGSEPCYLFVNVADALAGIEDNATIAEQMTAKGWIRLSGNVWYYNAIVDARTAAQDVVVFEYFKLKGDADVASYGSAAITITAYAAQADGFDGAQHAWNACFANS